MCISVNANTFGIGNTTFVEGTLQIPVENLPCWTLPGIHRFEDLSTRWYRKRIKTKQSLDFLKLVSVGAKCWVKQILFGLVLFAAAYSIMACAIPT